MKYRSKNPRVQGTPHEFIDVQLWDPKEPKDHRSQWFNDVTDRGEIVIETNDSISLPFPAMSSVYPGQYLIRLCNGDIVAASRATIDGNPIWERVEEKGN